MFPILKVLAPLHLLTTVKALEIYNLWGGRSNLHLKYLQLAKPKAAELGGESARIMALLGTSKHTRCFDKAKPSH